MVVNCEKITVYNPDEDRFFGGDSSEEARESFRDLYLSGEINEEEAETPVGPEKIMSSDRFSAYLAYLSTKAA